MNMLEKLQRVLLEIRDYKVEAVLQAWGLVGNGPDDVDPDWRRYTRMANSRKFRASGTSITLPECWIRKKDNN